MGGVRPVKVELRVLSTAPEPLSQSQSSQSESLSMPTVDLLPVALSSYLSLCLCLSTVPKLRINFACHRRQILSVGFEVMYAWQTNCLSLCLCVCVCVCMFLCMFIYLVCLCVCVCT